MELKRKAGVYALLLSFVHRNARESERFSAWVYKSA